MKRKETASLNPPGEAEACFLEEQIELVSLRVDCIVGVSPHEREREQPLYIDLAFPASFQSAAASENLEDTINYAVVAECVRSFVQTGRFHLLEALLRRLAQHLAQTYQLPALRLSVRKPQAVAHSEGARLSLHYVAPSRGPNAAALTQQH